MHCAHSLCFTAFLQAIVILLVFPCTGSGHQLPPVLSLHGSRSAASPNALITEAPSQDLLERNLAKRAFNPCTQWSVVGGSQVGCSGTQTCLFTTLAGYDWEYCGDIYSSPAFATHCYDYPTSWVGVSPINIAYCPKTLPYCGEFQFLFQGNTFFNLGCGTSAYRFTVVTTLGATFPGGSTTTSSPSPKPPSTTPLPPSPTTSIVISSSKTTTTPTPTTTPAPTTTPVPTTSSISSPVVPTTSKTSTTVSSSINPPSSTNPAPSSSSSVSPSPLPCSDSQWEPTPQNWFDADVDHQLAAWWANTTQQRGSYGFVEWLARSFGDLSHSQECGIGKSCAAPDCPSFQTSGAPRWAYFVHISLMEMNSLLNSMKTGMADAETDLSLIISDMASNFFPWKDPNTNLNHALPWIQAVVSTILSFIPFIGPELSGVPREVLSVVGSSTQALTSAGFQILSTGGSDPVSHQLGTISDLGVLIENTTKTMRNDLGTWSATLYNGGADSTGKTIRDYMGGGRFTVAYDIQPSFMDNFFLQVWVSKLVNEQWQDKVNSPSKTFVMCTNGTAACSETSKFTEGTRTCCLYSINNNANYVLPPAIEVLGNSTYNITPSDITASSLHSYLAQGLSYDDSKISATIENSISLNSSATFLAQGIRFQGVWTLPVCDVGTHGDWVANTAAGLMPCCCGPSCTETIQFWNNTGVLKLQGLHDKCKTQCSTCPTSTAHGKLRLMGMNVADGVYFLAVFYFVALILVGA